MTPTTGKRSIFASNKNGDRPISEEAKKNTAGVNWAYPSPAVICLTPSRPLRGGEQKRFTLSIE